LTVTIREQVEEEEEEDEERETQVESTSHNKTESSTSDSEEDDKTKEVKEEEEKLFKEKTIDSMRNEVVKEEPIQPGTFGGFSFKKRTNFKKPQIRQRINENDY